MAKKGNLLVISWNPGGEVIAAGGFRRACEIINRFPKHYGRVTIIDSDPTYFSHEIPNSKLYSYKTPRWVKRVTDWSFNFGRLIEWTMSAITIYRLAAKNRQDYEVVYVPYSEMLVVTIPGYFIKTLLHKEVVFCNQNKDHICFKLWLNNLLHNRVDKIISVSNQLAYELEQQGKKKPVYTGLVGLNYEEVVNTPKQQKAYDALFIGRHVESKGVFDCARMVVEMIKEKPDFKFVSIGIATKSVLNEITDILRNGGAENNWQYLGVVDDKEKYKILKQSRCVWFLSSLEGWGIVPQEALAAEVTPICYDIPVYAEHIKKTDATILVPDKDWRAALQAYKKFLSIKTDQLARMHQAGREFVRQYNWGNVAKREFDIIYEETTKVRF